MARERCFRTCLMYGRRWEIGEERNVDAFDADGQPVASSHFRLADSSDPAPANVVRGPDEEAQEEAMRLRGDHIFAIRKALEAMDPEDDGNWTIQGYVAVSRVFQKVGFEVQRGDIVEAWPEFDRELARELRD